MSLLVDTMLEGPSESFIQVHEDGIKLTQIILDSVTRCVLNAPNDISYLNGTNVALHAKSINCGEGNAGGLVDTGSGFSDVETSKVQASIFIDGNVACQGEGKLAHGWTIRATKL